MCGSLLWIYIYDGSTNLIIPNEGNLSDLIENNEAFNRSMIYDNASSEIRGMMDKWKLFSHETPNADEDFINKEIIEFPYPQIILGLTEDCNLRCKYCIFSGSYENMRTHGFAKMPKDVAIKSVDKFIDYVKEWKEFAPEKKPVISFYGGEPLLEYDMIKEVVAHVKTKNFKPMFALTTNGNLLNDEIIEFFVTNDFAVSVSLDGPEELHDKNRVFENGEGSFHTIYTNIMKLKKEIIRQGKESELFIMILTCYEKDTDMVKLNEFFIHEKQSLYGMLGRVSEVMDTENHDQSMPSVNESLRQLYNMYINGLFTDEDRSNFYFLERIYGNLLQFSYSRNIYLYGQNYSQTLGNAAKKMMHILKT